MKNMNQNIVEATKATPIFCQYIPQVLFQTYFPVLSPSVLTVRVGCPDVPASSGDAHVAHALTDTATHDTATPAAIGSVKINLNRARPTEGPSTTHILPYNPDGYIMLAASSGCSDGKSEYF